MDLKKILLKIRKVYFQKVDYQKRLQLTNYDQF